MSSEVVAGIFNDPSYRIFAWWAAVLMLKILVLIPMIGRLRFAKRVFLSSEDASFVPKSKVSYTDPDIERVRRAHLNDIESILPWVVSTMFWLSTSPCPQLAATLIKAFGICRIVHTLVYAFYPVPQPTRFLAFSGGFVITVYQVLATIRYYS